jgi:hypothetical protein
LIVGFAIVTAIDFLAVFLYRKDTQLQQFFVFFLLIPLLLGSASFLGFLLMCLWATGVQFRASVVFSLTCYVLSGALPVLMILSHQQLGEAIRLFLARQDPSLPYFAAATVGLIFPERASILAIVVSRGLFMLWVAAAIWYLFWNLRRVLVEASKNGQQKVRVTISLLMALGLNSLLVRLYAERLYWLIVGRLLL